MTPIKTKRISIKQRIISYGEKMHTYRLERQQSIKAAKQAKRNKRLTKAEREAIEAQMLAEDND